MNFLDWQDADIVEITLRTIGRNPAADDNIPNFPSFEPPIERLGLDDTVISRLSFESGLPCDDQHADLETNERELQ